MNLASTDPGRSRALRKVLRILGTEQFTPDEVFAIWTKLHVYHRLARRGPQLGAACMRNHPDKPSRWSKGTKRVKAKSGEWREYATQRCLECDAARDARTLKKKTQPVVKPQDKPRQWCATCPHGAADHKSEDGGRCYHRNSAKVYDCDCAPATELEQYDTRKAAR